MMDKIDFEKLRKMPPERKIKALKELQEKLNSLIKERSKEISDSEQEVKGAQEFLKEAEEELRVLEEMQEQAPELKGVQVEKLFERTESRTEPTRPRDRELEDIAGEAKRPAPGPEEVRDYINQGARKPMGELRERVYNVLDDIKNTGIITAYQQDKLEQFREMIHEKGNAYKEGEYNPQSKGFATEMTGTERAIEYAIGHKHESQFYKTRHQH